MSKEASAEVGRVTSRGVGERPTPAGGSGPTTARKRRRWAEWFVERAIFLVSLSAIVMIFLIFAFVGREALPVILGKTNNARGEINPDEFKMYDAETARILLELKQQELAETTNPDARFNTTSWHFLLRPHQWVGYEKPRYIWQPVSEIPKYNIVPLVIGSLKATLVALLVSVPLGVGAAIYVSQLAKPRWREMIKPTIELLSGIPSVVLGFFALIVMASVLQTAFGYHSRLNAFVAGLALGLAVIPVIFTISEDALTSVPRGYAQAALALGAAPWQVAWQIVLPAALPGVFAACVLGFGRAIGETMIVLMASGNATIVSASIFDSCRTITATIAAELAEVVFGGDHYRILFLLGTLLFGVTFLTNIVGDLVVHRLKRRLEGGG
jgi:phosphate transport system permease protein